MADRFTDSQMLKLVLIYRDYDSLWNVTSPLYKNREARNSAYKEISKKLNIPGISEKDIPKKIKNLRSSYYQELKKIKDSIRSGASQDSVYRPKVSWFTEADGFMRICRIKRETLSNSDEISYTTSENEDSESHYMEPVEDEPVKKIKKINKREDIHEAIDHIDKNVNNANSFLVIEDELDAFGKYIVTSLRSLPSDLAIIAKTDIQKALSEIQLRALR